MIRIIWNARFMYYACGIRAAMRYIVRLTLR